MRNVLLNKSPILNMKNVTNLMQKKFRTLAKSNREIRFRIINEYIKILDSKSLNIYKYYIIFVYKIVLTN